MTRRITVALGVVVWLPLAVLTVALASWLVVRDRALPGTTVAGHPVAGMTRSQLADALTGWADAVTVQVSSSSKTETDTLADLGFAVDVPRTVTAVFAANSTPLASAAAVLGGRDVAALVTADRATVQAAVDRLVTSAGVAGSDASVGLSADGTTFQVRPAVTGRTVSADSLQEVVVAAGRRLTSTPATLSFVARRPTVDDARAQAVADAANTLVAHSVEVSDGQTTHAATAAERASWVVLPALDAADATPTLDPAKVTAWIQQVAATTETAVTAGVRNVRSDGSVAVVVSPGTAGRSATDVPAVASAAVAALGAGRDYAATLTYATVEAGWVDRPVAVGAENLAYPAADGEKWVDVNLTAHTMTAYQGATVVYGPIAMVNGAAATPTVVGSYHVYLKVRSQTMRGDNADGTTYETAGVPWISYFTGNYALHGAPWRSSFGYAASHGCINLPVPAAHWIYDWDEVGTPVVTHL